MEKRFMNNLRDNYLKKANDLYERLMDEQPEETPPTEEAPEAPDAEAGEDAPEAEEEQGQAQKVDIFFDNLDKQTQTVLINTLKEALNATEDDKISEGKIKEFLTKEPLISLLADELIRKLKIEV